MASSAVGVEIDGPEGDVRRSPGLLRSMAADLNVAVGAAIVIVLAASAIFAPFLAPYDPLAIDASGATQGPSFKHPMGTDEFGRDILSRVMWGGRASLTVAVGAVVLAGFIGVPLGLIAGYFGGWFGAFLMRLLDAVLAFPVILLAILIMSALGTSNLTLMGTIGFLYVPYFGRLARGCTLSLKSAEFVEASIACGNPAWRILLLVILPNIATPILVQSTLAMGVTLLIEAGLSYIGLGIQPPTPAWGSMLRASQGYMHAAPWYVLAPGLMICMAVVGFNIVSDGLRDMLDPQTRRTTANRRIQG